jgi:hypothetical protein
MKNEELNVENLPWGFSNLCRFAPTIKNPALLCKAGFF